MLRLSFNRFDVYLKSMQKGAQTSVKLYKWDNSIPPNGTPEELGILKDAKSEA